MTRKREKAIWWVNHLFEIRKEEYFNKGMIEDAKEVEEAQYMAIYALQEDGVIFVDKSKKTERAISWLKEMSKKRCPTRELVETTEDLNEAQSRIIIRNNKDCEINIYASNNRLEGLEGIENADR